VLPLISGLTIIFIFTLRIWRGIGLIIVVYYGIIMFSLVIVNCFLFGYLFFDKKKFLYYFPILFLIFFRIVSGLILVLFYDSPTESVFSTSSLIFLVFIVIVTEYFGYYFSMNRDKKALQNQNHLKPYSTHKPKYYQQNNAKYCPYCGASVKYKDFYCIKCGKSLKVDKI